MKIILGIDTTLDRCSIALLKGEKCFRDSQQMQRGHAEILMPKIINLLKDAEVTFADLDLITVTVGPGSFTGLRIGLATAKGLSLAGEIPLVGFKTFEVLAHCIPAQQFESSNLLVALDSRRADIYCQLYNSQLLEVKPAATVLPEDILGYTGDQPLQVIGNGSHFLKEQLLLHHPQVIFQNVDIALVPQVLCQMGSNLFPLNYQENDLETCQPFYLRPPDVTLPK